MSDNDYADLRALAEAVDVMTDRNGERCVTALGSRGGHTWDTGSGIDNSPVVVCVHCGKYRYSNEGRRQEFRAAANPARILALLADLDAARAEVERMRRAAWHDLARERLAEHDALAAKVGRSIDADHLAHQREWSTATFGPGTRLLGVLDHIRKELAEIEADPTDLGEWVDVLILAFDGAWRAGWEPQQIIDAVKAKQARNEARTWPDWRGRSEDEAIEHVRGDTP